MTAIHVPQGCARLSDIKEVPQFRLGIQGYPGVGKTWSALTCPNPIVANLDRGLRCHQGRTDVIEIPFHNPDYCKTIMPRFTPPDLKDVLIKWVETEGMKLSPAQTLVWDGNTSTQAAYHKWYEANKLSFLTKDGKINDFAEWNYKVTFYGELLELFKYVKCNVVFICHEIDRPDKVPVGEAKRYSGKIRPLITGQVGDSLVGAFTDFYRQLCANKPEDFNKLEDAGLVNWKLKKTEFKAMCDEYWPDCPSMYYWQTIGDDTFDAKCSLVGAPKFIPAHYNSLIKYERKPKISM